MSLCSSGGVPQLIDHMLTPVVSLSKWRLCWPIVSSSHITRLLRAPRLKAKFGVWPSQIFDTVTAERHELSARDGLGVSNKLGDALERGLGSSSTPSRSQRLGQFVFLTL